jgi:hypothetical protein
MLALTAPLGSLSRDRMTAYGQVCLLFLGRMRNHAESIQKLGRSRDTILIARSGLEGVLWFEWISKDKTEERAKQYLELRIVGFANLVADLDLDLADQPAEWQEIISEELPKVSEEVLPAGDYNNLIQQESVNNRGFGEYLLKEGRVKAIFKSLGLENLYNNAYSLSSKYQHWEPIVMPKLSVPGKLDKDFEGSAMQQAVSLKDITKMLAITGEMTAWAFQQSTIWREIRKERERLSSQADKYEWL